MPRGPQVSHGLRTTRWPGSRPLALGSETDDLCYDFMTRHVGDRGERGHRVVDVPVAEVPHHELRVRSADPRQDRSGDDPVRAGSGSRRRTWCSPNGFERSWRSRSSAGSGLTSTGSGGAPNTRGSHRGASSPRRSHHGPVGRGTVQARCPVSSYVRRARTRESPTRLAPDLDGCAGRAPVRRKESSGSAHRRSAGTVPAGGRADDGVVDPRPGRLVRRSGDRKRSRRAEYAVATGTSRGHAGLLDFRACERAPITRRSR